MQKGQNDVLKNDILPPKVTLPYEVPYGYFEHLPNRVIQRLQAEEKPTGLGFRQPWKWSLAALMLVAIGCLWMLRPEINQTQKALSAVPQDEITQYLLTHSDPPALMVMAATEEIEFAWDGTIANLSDQELIEWVEETEILNVMEEL